ncbi:DUF721 domain-containing protein [Pseudomonas sp. P14-2025]
MKAIENQSCLWLPVPTPSRVNPLLRGIDSPGRSGFTREEAGTGNGDVRLCPRHLTRTPMAYKPSPAQPPSALLRQVRPLRLLLNQAERLEHLQRLLESQLQPAAREHCHVASWRDGTLLLVVTDGHWATRLRYQQKRLLAALQAMEAFGNLRRILYKVQPPLVPAKRGGHAAELSNSAAESLRDTAEGITDPKLRAALERLATHAQGKP